MDVLEKSDLDNEPEQTEKPKFEVHDLSSATWVMRKLRVGNAWLTHVLAS